MFYATYTGALLILFQSSLGKSTYNEAMAHVSACWTAIQINHRGSLFFLIKRELLNYNDFAVHE